MEELDGSHNDAFSLIDDDDFLLASSSEANTLDNPADIFIEGAHKDQPSDLLASQRPRKTGKCNLRKSLAWDSAFFTNAGVLDAEELTSIIEGTETSTKQIHFLPGIQEDLSKSTDSISTFESDSLTLESLEADLFCDIRASIQRGNKPFTLGSSSSSVLHGGKSGNGSSRKIVEPSSGRMMKPTLAPKKQTFGVQGPMKASRPSSVSNQGIKPSARNRELSSSHPRPPIATGTPSLERGATTKRMSVGASRVRLESNTSGNTKVMAGKGDLIPKVPHQVVSRNTLPKVPPTSKCSSASSVTNKNLLRSSRTSCDSSSSSSSECIRKSAVGIVRRKIDKNTSLSSASKVRTPSRVLVKSKSGESHLSAYVKSTSKLSPSVSPASSVSEWSTESSSSTAINQKKFGLQHCPTSEDVIMDNNVSQYVQKHSINRPSDGHEIEVESTTSQPAKQPSNGISVPPTRPGSAKPSGLRLPSPKIGFFDGAKVGAKTLSGTVRSRPALPSSLHRSGSGTSTPSTPAIKTKLGNIVAKTTTEAAGTAKHDPRGTNASPKPTAQLLDHSGVLSMPSNDKNVHNDSDTSSEVVKSIEAKSASKGNSKVAVISGGGKHVNDFGLVAKDHSPGLVKHPRTMNLDSDTCLNSPNSAPGKDSKVTDEADGRKCVIDSGSKDTSVKSRKEENAEGKLQLTVDLMTVAPKDVADFVDTVTDSFECVCASPSSVVHQCNRSNSSSIKNLSSSQKVDGEASLYSSQHEGNVVLGAISGNQDSENGTVETEQNAFTENLVEELNSYVKTREHNIDEQSESGNSFQLETILKDKDSPCPTIPSCLKEWHDYNDNETAQCVSLLPCSFPLPSMGVSPATRTPAVKNVLAGSGLGANDHSPGLLDHLSDKIVDNIDTCSELPNLPKSASGKSSNVAKEADDRKCVVNSGSEDTLVVSKEEENAEAELQLTGDLATVAPEDVADVVDTITDDLKGVYASPSSKVDQCNRSNSFGVENRSLSQEGDGPVSPDATDGNQDSVNGAVETEQNADMHNLEEELYRHVKTEEHHIDLQRESGNSFQLETIQKGNECPEEIYDYDGNETALCVSLIPCSLSLPSVGVSSGTRTPFAVKNSVSDMAERSNSSTGSAVEAFVKIDAAPSLENDLKENC